MVTMENLPVKVQEALDRTIRNEGRIKKLENEHQVLQDLATSIAVMGEQLKTMNVNVEVLANKVDRIEEKPKKKWENLVEKIMWFVIAAFLGFVLAHIGL